MAWKAGSAGICASASGCAGTTDEGDCGRCVASDSRAACLKWPIVAEGRGALQLARVSTRHYPTPCSAVTDCGFPLSSLHHEHSSCVQPLDAENRTSSGVGGCRDAIPGTRPDPRLMVAVPVDSGLRWLGT